MMKQMLPLASLLILPLTATAEGPIDGELYGKINISLDAYERDYDNPGPGEEDVDEWQLNSNASRIGVKGETELNESLSVIYQLEWQVEIDGDGDDLTPRNRYLGLKGGFGTVLAGKHDTPVKLAQHDIDLFNDLEGDIKRTFEGENRIDDIVMYTSPAFGPVTLQGAFSPAEGDPEDDGAADGFSLAATVTLEPLYVTLAADRDIDGQDLVRLTAQYTIGDLMLGAMAQQNDDSGATNVDTIDEQGVFFSAAYSIGDGKIKAQAGRVENDAPAATDFNVIEEEDTLSVGYDHKLGERTKVFTYLTRNTDTQVDGDEIQDTVFGVGAQHKF